MESPSRSRASLVSPCSCLCRALLLSVTPACGHWAHLSLQAGALGLSAGGGFSEWTELFLSPGDASSVELLSWERLEWTWGRESVCSWFFPCFPCFVSNCLTDTFAPCFCATQEVPTQGSSPGGAPRWAQGICWNQLVDVSQPDVLGHQQGPSSCEPGVGGRQGDRRSPGRALCWEPWACCQQVAAAVVVMRARGQWDFSSLIAGIREDAGSVCGQPGFLSPNAWALLRAWCEVSWEGWPEVKSCGCWALGKDGAAIVFL